MKRGHQVEVSPAWIRRFSLETGSRIGFQARMQARRSRYSVTGRSSLSEKAPQAALRIRPRTQLSLADSAGAFSGQIQMGQTLVKTLMRSHQA